MPTAANTEGLDPCKYQIINKGQFVFSGMQTGRDKCIRVALYNEVRPALVSPAYTVFELKEDAPILPEYLFMNFIDPEMDRYGWFISDCSIRANLDWERFCDIKIPLPSIDVQKSIVALFNACAEHTAIAREVAYIQHSSCPVLINAVKREARKER